MTSDEEPSAVTIQYTPEFKRALRQLAKKYRNIKTDLQPFLDALQQGQTPEDQIPNVSFEAYKVRLSNSDSGKGKSGGYRVVYQRSISGGIVLITLYSKTEQEDVSLNELRAIIVDYDKQVTQTQEAESKSGSAFPSISLEDDL